MLTKVLRSTHAAVKAGPSARPVLAQRSFHASRIAQDHFLDANDEAFSKRALDEANAKPILVDFYAEWCQPCRVLTPLLKSHTGPDSAYDLMTVNVDDYPDLAAKFKVSALPTVVAFKNGAVKNKFVGFRGDADIKKFLGLL
ncbi:thioredoxin [Kwoniella pini CBS 10737]|uniref:Thioredoxin n=1 Tax=Kwoniella pini CBS 10737 TaxID=1296096 RepID=A0A1B9I602_9TREE|nr:thioredoxin [Kwoniella pini CBS 10737]OCF50954.1 thioredoxin [Kwoniella pini CBS 10737]